MSPLSCGFRLAGAMVSLAIPLSIATGAEEPGRWGPALDLQTLPGGDHTTLIEEVHLRAGGRLPVGFGLAVAFPSSKLELERCEEVYADGLLGVSAEPEEDAGDVDGDPATDRLVRVAWLEPVGEWSGNHGEVVLARFVFRVRAGVRGEPVVSATPLGGAAVRPARRVVGDHDQAVTRFPERDEILPEGGVRELESRSTRRLGDDAAATCSLDVDGNGQFDALTDGILVMRYLFGFSGSSLTANALGSGATRSDAASIQAFLGDSSCAGMLDADGNGVRDALTDGILIARYLFGFSGSTLTANAIGSGATRTDGGAIGSFLGTYRTTGPVLVLTAPVLEAPLLSLIPATLRVPTTYTGTGTVTYTLVTGPSGMTIDGAAGVLSWTPAASLEGQQATVTVSGTDGTLSGEVTFAIRVAGATPVTTSVSGSTVTVTQSGTLQGLAITVPSGASVPASGISVKTVPDAQAPTIPDGVTRISDFFRLTPVDGGPGLLSLALPTSRRPSGRAAENVRLFVYTSSIHDFPDGPLPERTWIPTWYDLDVRPDGLATIKLQGIGELCFIGVEEAGASPVAPLNASGPSRLQAGAASVTINCAPRPLLNGFASVSQQVCVITGDVALTVTVKQFGNLDLDPAASRDEFLGWLVAARKAFGNLGLASDAAFEVVFEQMPAEAPDALGFVSTKNLEDRRVLHITKNKKQKGAIQGTAVHEYFHHAQARTKVAGLTNVMDLGRPGHWIVEGTARWFEDEIFDTLNTYSDKERPPAPMVLSWGLAATPEHVDNDPAKPIIRETRAYARFAWWKMVGLSCSGFSLPELFNFNTASDPVGLGNLAARFASGRWLCDFGAGFGDENKATLAAALLYYTYATVKEDDISRLDSNEPYYKFTGSPWVLTPSDTCAANWDDCPDTAKFTGESLPPAASSPTRLAAVAALDPGSSAFVRVVNTNDDGDLWVWVGDNEKSGGLTDGKWFKVEPNDDNTLVYATEQRAPETLVIVINPDASKTLNYDIFAGLASAYAIYPDLEGGIMEPVFYPGSPDVDFSLTLRSQLEFPDQYKIVWSFDDGTADVTVNNDPEVTHRWTQVGDFDVTAKLYSLPSNTLVGQAQGIARLGYFWGQFRLYSFTGGTSGEFGAPESKPFIQFLAGVAANPSAAQVSVSRWSDGDLDAYLYDGSDTYYLAHYSTDYDNDTTDCRQHFTITDNRLSARWANPQYGFPAGELAGQCMSLEMTQTGAQIEGTFSFWAKYYQSEGPPVTEGAASYTFRGTYEKQ